MADHPTFIFKENIILKLQIKYYTARPENLGLPINHLCYLWKNIFAQAMCSLVILLQIDFLGLNIAQAQEKSHAMYFIMASDKIALLTFFNAWCGGNKKVTNNKNKPTCSFYLEENSQ